MNYASGVAHEEHRSLRPRKRAAVHSKRAMLSLSISGEALVNHHPAFQRARHVAIPQEDGIAAFNHGAFGTSGDEGSVFRPDVARGIDAWRVLAMGDDFAAGDPNDPATPVSSDHPAVDALGDHVHVRDRERAPAAGHHPMTALSGGAYGTA